MMQAIDLLLQWSINLMVIFGAVWVVLRVVEKIYDIQLKGEELKYMTREEVSE